MHDTRLRPTELRRTRPTRVRGTSGGGPTVKRADLRWLAAVSVLVALPFLVFGLLWQALVQLAVGVGVLVLAFGIWMLFADD